MLGLNGEEEGNVTMSQENINQNNIVKGLKVKSKNAQGFNPFFDEEGKATQGASRK